MKERDSNVNGGYLSYYKSLGLVPFIDSNSIWITLTQLNDS